MDMRKTGPITTPRDRDRHQNSQISRAQFRISQSWASCRLRTVRGILEYHKSFWTTRACHVIVPAFVGINRSL
jgi:hypothetical protein